MKYYAGVGSRETPSVILTLMFQMARHLAVNNYTLKSGGAAGADTAFEKGCDSVNGNKEIFLPWAKFQGSDSQLILKDKRAEEIAEKFHPYWGNLSQGARKLQARNSHQALGKDLQTKSSFIVCYTDKGKGTGGTGQIIRIAEGHGIPVFDCGLFESNIELLKDNYKSFLREINYDK